jgi:hypothetical protein
MLRGPSIIALPLALTAAIVAGCCAATQGTAPSKTAIEDAALYAAPFDKVWGAVVATLSEESYPIGAIDKSSGLITTQQVILLEGLSAMVATDSYAVRPSNLLGRVAIDKLRVSMNVFANSQDSGSTRVKVTAHFEGMWTGEAANGWYVCPSKGLLEKRLLDAVRAKL